MLWLAPKFLSGGGGQPPPPTPEPPPVVVPPVIAPPPAAGSLKATTVAVPYTGVATVLGQSKHLSFALVGGRWYKVCGDHRGIDKATSPPMVNQDGRQEVLSVNFAANDWRQETPYYLPSGVQQAFPDDAFCIARGDEIFVFAGDTANPLPPHQPAGKAAQLWGRITAFNPATGTYRDVAPMFRELQGNRSWCGCYDAKLDRFIIPARVNELVWVVIDGATGKDLTYRYPSGNPRESGGYRVNAGGMVGDPASRVRYLYERYRHEIYSVNIDTFAMTLLATLPEPPTTGGNTVGVVWHPVKRCVVIGHTKLHAFEVDSAKLTTWARADGFTNKAGVYVPPSTMMYDAGDIVSIGGIDWDGMVSPSYWRTSIE